MSDTCKALHVIIYVDAMQYYQEKKIDYNCTIGYIALQIAAYLTWS